MSYEWPETFWPHQLAGCEQVLQAINDGTRRIVLTSPTGGGKTAMMTELIRWASSEWMDSSLYTMRRLLCSQTARELDKAGIDHGIRAAGYKPALLRQVQLTMTQTEYSAVYKRKSRALHPAKLVLVDEYHMQGGEMMRQILGDHYDAGAATVAVTATPLDMQGEWDRLIVAGTNSELRKCGALVPAYTFAPDQPELKHVKKYRIGEDLSDADNAKVMMRPGVFGRVYQHWARLNPKRLPTLLFAPDVAGSIYFAEQFDKAGVRSAHIDAKQIWHRGEFLESDDETRHRILQMTQTGEIEVLCNRFVLREGINLPHIAVGILATVIGSLRSYIQIVGRILRAHPGLDHVTLVDHGGNFIRHGSPNADREWELGQNGYKTTGLRQEGMREKPETEPIRCPKCGMMRLSGPVCPACGHACHKRSRLVVQINGDLRLVEGPSYTPRRVKMTPTTEADWISMYHRARSKKWDATFNQAEALFFHEHHHYPPRTLPFMPTSPGDWFEKVSSVPKERLQ